MDTMEVTRPLRSLHRPAARGLFAALALLVVAGSALAGDRVASEIRGTGSPTIVLIHSIGGDRSDWDPVTPALAKRHRLLLVDLPGHGGSAAPDKATVKAAARAIAEVLARNKVTGALLVGHSYGALVALEIAASKPKVASAVVAVDGTTYTQADSAQMAQVATMLRERYSVFVHAVYERMSTDPARAESLAAHAMRVKPEILSAYFEDAWRADLRPRLKTMKTPIHVVATGLLWPPEESWTITAIH